MERQVRLGVAYKGVARGHLVDSPEKVGHMVLLLQAAGPLVVEVQLWD
jgi:hypothetical protein